jgi:hypothetical protein
VAVGHFLSIVVAIKASYLPDMNLEMEMVAMVARATA